MSKVLTWYHADLYVQQAPQNENAISNLVYVAFGMTDVPNG